MSELRFRCPGTSLVRATTTSLTRGSVWEVFRVFLRLGITSFGGPIAHLGYFRSELVGRRRWLDDRAYAELVTLCQFLPGPASSQVGFWIGLRRAGLGGAIAAFLGFTLPSAALMLAFAFGAEIFAGPVGAGALAGLKIVAVAIVAQALLGMARMLTPDATRAVIAVAAAAMALLLAGPAGQLLAIALGAVAGLWLCRSQGAPALPHSPVSQRPGEEAGEPTAPPATQAAFRISRRTGFLCLALFAALLATLPLATGLIGGAPARTGAEGWLKLFDAAVVEPGWVTDSQFLAGYGAAQAMPGPLFSFAGYLGAVAQIGPGGVMGAAVALLGIFLPGLLLLIGVLRFWEALRRYPRAQAAIRGANAAVVGVLAAAPYSPVFVTAITSAGPLLVALACFALLVVGRLPSWIVVIVGALGGTLLELIV